MSDGSAERHVIDTQLNPDCLSYTASYDVASDICWALDRDGSLNFMFRVGDVRDRKVIMPSVRACLYTWNGRRTHEGEHIPVLAQPMEINYRDDCMVGPCSHLVLLLVTVIHPISTLD
jgi:hypothetical protein